MVTTINFHIENGALHCKAEGCSEDIVSATLSLNIQSEIATLQYKCAAGHTSTMHLTIDTQKGTAQTVSMRTKVSGVTFPNQDGTSRQELLKRISAGDSLTIEHIMLDGKSVPVLRHAIGIIGTLKSEIINEFKGHCAPDAEITAKVLQVTGGTENKNTLGCNIIISAEAKDERMPGKTTEPEINRAQKVFVDPAKNTVYHTDRHCSGMKNAEQCSLGYAEVRLHARPCKRCCRNT